MNSRHTAILTVFFLVVIVLGGLYVWGRKQAPAVIIQPTLSQDLYPLYTGVNWNAPEFESFVIGTSTFAGASITSTSIAAGMDPGGIFTPFERYYDQKLKALGWNVANDLAAGGHVGGQTGYRKGSEVILTRFSILYHTVTDTAPSECPCDVTLSLFSTN